MKTVRYIGPLADGVFVPDHDADRVIRPGETVEVEDALADSLAEQADNWEAVKPATKGGGKKDEGVSDGD